MDFSTFLAGFVAGGATVGMVWAFLNYKAQRDIDRLLDTDYYSDRNVGLGPIFRQIGTLLQL